MTVWWREEGESRFIVKPVATSVHVNVSKYNRLDQLDPSPLSTACIVQHSFSNSLFTQGFVALGRGKKNR